MAMPPLAMQIAAHASLPSAVQPSYGLGTAAAKYIDAFYANLHWDAIDRRTAAALELAAIVERSGAG